MIAAPTTQFWRSRPRQVRKGRGAAAFFAALTVYIIVILVAAPQAQQPPAFTGATPATPATSAVVRDAISGTDIDLMVGRSTVLNVGATIARVSLTVPDIADALVTAPTQLLVHGKQPGTISLFVWDKEGSIKTFEVKVRRDLSALVAHLKQLFPGEDISVVGSGKDVVVSGTVSSKYVVEKAADVAAGYVEKKDNVVNMLKQQEGVASNQVMLKRPLRRSQPQRHAGARRHVLRQRLQERVDWPHRASRSAGADLRRRQDDLQRLPQPVRVQRQGRPRRRDPGAVRTRASSRAWPSRT